MIFYAVNQSLVGNSNLLFFGLKQVALVQLTYFTLFQKYINATPFNNNYTIEHYKCK